MYTQVSKLFALAAVGLVLLGLESASPPAAAQEPEAAPVCPASTVSFADVPAGHYAKADIECLSALGIINGTSATAFSPDRKITRAQTAALLARMWRKQGQDCTATTDRFADVPAGHYAKADIECLSALGIINGTSATAFSPDRKITRAQTAALLARMWRKQGQDCTATTDRFADVPAGHYAKADIECLSALGIINGTSATAFSPDRKITRAQTAALLARMWRQQGEGPAEETVTDGGGGGAPPGGAPPGGAPPPGGSPPPSGSEPSQPARPGLTVGYQSLGVSWTAPANNGAAITDYDVAYRIEDADMNRTGKQPSRWVPHAHTGAGTTATIGSLANGTAYQVRVRAENSYGEGQWSPLANKVPAGVPAPPGGPMVMARHQGLAVSWAAPADNGAAITDYDVEIQACTATPKTCTISPAWGTWTSHPHAGAGTTVTIGSLTNGTAYRVRVQAANSVGKGDWSDHVQGTPAPQPPSAPSTSGRRVSQGYEVFWVAPANNGQPITGYEVRYRIQNSDNTWPPTWTFYTATDAATTSIVLSDSNTAAARHVLAATNTPDSNTAAARHVLAATNTPDSNTAAARHVLAATNTAEVQTQVRAVNDVGKGDWSAQPPDAPGAPQVTSIGEGLTATWTAPAANGAPVTGYSVRFRVQDTDQGQTGDQPGSWTAATGNADPGTNTTATITGLTNGTAYEVQVRAANSAGAGDWSPSATGTPVAKKPARPSAPIVMANSQALDVSWSAPASNGAAITDYDVQHRACTATDGDTSVKTCAANPTWEANWTDRTGETGADTATQITITGLVNGTAHQVRVRAANSVGESEWSPVSKGTPTIGGAPDPQPPDAPAAPTVDARNQRLRVSWQAPAINGSAVTGYSVRFRITDTDTGQTGDQPGNWTYQGHMDTSTHTVIESLANGVSHQVQVLARSVAGDSDWSSSTAATPVAQTPDQPAAPTVIVWNRSLRTSWTAPASNGAAVTDFDLQWRACTAADKTCANSPAWSSWTDRGSETTPDTATSATITGLANGTAYQVQVRAANSAGESGWSLSTTAVPTAQRPEAPDQPTVTPWHRSLRVSWTAPADNGATVTDYDLQHRACTATDGDTSVKTCTTGPTWGTWTDRSGETASDTATMGTISGLTDGTAYQVRLRAANSAGESVWSQPSANGAPTAQKPEAPEAPTLTHGDQSLAVSWTAPADNGATISDYDVQHRACTATPKTCTSSPTWGDWTSHTHTGAGTSTTIGSLANGTAYQVQVRAANSVGDSTWSPSSSEYPSTTPGAPAVPTLTVQDQGLGVSWSAPSGDGGSAVTGYKVGRCSSSCGTDSNWTVTTLTGTGTTATLSGLTNGTAYQVRVAATNRSGDSAWGSSATATPATAPDTPSAPTVTVWNESLNVSWTAPEDNGADITDYDVQHRACTATPKTCTTNPSWGTWTSHTHTGTGTTATIGSLTNGTAYEVRVQATNSVGDSAWSASTTATPTAQKPEAPAAPTLTDGDQSLAVSWTAPADNGADISGYKVRHCDNSTGCDDDTEWTAKTLTGTGTSTTITGLTNGTNYQVQVRAANSVGDGAWSASSSEYPSTTPAAPAAPTLTANDESLAVSWSAPSGDGGSAVTGYKVGRCSSDCGTDSNWTVTTLTGTGTTTTLSGLTNGTAYQVRVAAANRSGDSAWSASATATPVGAPEAPAAPTVTVWNESLTVSWTAPADNGADITDYDVQHRACTATPKTCTTNPSWGTWTSHTHTGTGTTATIGSLTNGTAYEVQVQATNSVGDSAWSASATATPTAQKPEAPAAPTLTHGDQSLAVSWTAPANNGATITDYDVRHCVNSTGCDADDEWTALDDTGDNASDTATTASITGLTNGTAYQVQVRAANSVGDGAWSASATEYPSTVPAAPAAPTLTVQNQSLNVSWSAPSGNGGSAVTGYKVGRCSSGCGTDSNWTVTTLTGTGTTTTLSSLTNGTAYQVRVAAANRSGDSAWSSSATATPASVPDTPAAATLTKGAEQLGVSWTAPSGNGSPITGYEVQYRIKDTDEATNGDQPGSWVSHSHTGTGTSTTITGLTNGTNYQVQVQAANSVGDSGWSASAEAAPEDKPAQPAAPTLTHGDQSLSVSWTAPAANGQAISGYGVQHRACTATPKTCTTSPTWGDWTSHSHTGTGTTATIGSLTNGTAYQVQVRATNSVGDSAWSASASEYPSTVPGAPAVPSLTVGDQSLGVSWSAPSGDGGSAVTGYKVGRCSSGCDTGSNWTVTTLTGTGTTTTLSSLTNGTAYQVRVAATNRSGDSAWSTSATATPARAPDKPTAPTVTVWNASLNVSWTAPAANGAAITDYDVQYRACTATPLSCTTSPTWGDWTSHAHTGTGVTATLSSLTNGTAYQVQVRATNSVGDSAWSDSTSATPAAQKPSTPAAPTLTHGDRSLSVSWTAPAANGQAISGYGLRHRACTATPKTCTSSPTWGDWASHTHTGTGTSTTIGSLTNGTAYQVQVRATTSVGDSAWSASASEYPSTTPDAPAVPSLTVGDQSLGVSWSAPSGDGGSAVTGYKVGRCSSNCGTDSNWTVTTLTGTGTTATLSGLTNGTAYQVRVAATNRSGDSAWSTASTATPATAPDTPAAPAVTVWNESLNVSWTAPAANGADITDYDVQHRACTATPKTCTSSPTWGDWTSHAHTGTGTSTTIGSLTNGTAYQVQVRATNSVGDSAWSASTAATPAAQKPSTPAAPTLTHGDRSLGVSWTAPSANGADISDYDVQHRACTATPKTCTTSPTWGDWTSHAHTGTGTTASISSLTNGTAYQVQVRAANSVGDSGWSASAGEYPSTTPGAPTALSLSVGDESLGVSWSAPSGDGGSAVTGYKVGRCSSGCDTGSNWTVTTLTGTGTTTTLSSLTNGTAYQVRVAAANRSGDSAWSSSATATPARVPDKPAAPTATVWNESLNVSWTAPAANGADITDYDVQYRACTATPKTCTSSPTWGDWTSHAHTGTGTTTTISSLTNGTAYQVQVRATNSVGDSAWSDSTSATPAAQKPSTPAAPSLTVGTQSLAVSWTAPQTNGADITGYGVQYRACTATPKTCTSSPTWGDWASHTHTGTGTTATISSLTNGTAYQVQVRATNSVGDSAWSASASEYPSTTPDAPAAPSLTVRDQSLGVSWSAPAGDGGSAVTGYKVGRCSSSCDTGSNWTVTTLTGTDTTTTLSSLTNGTAYQVRVAATNRSGDSGWSTSATATPARAPDKPTAPTVTVSNASLNVSWTAPASNGADITDYDVQYRACTATPLTCTTSPTWGTWTSHSHTGTGTSTTIGSLTNGTAYQVQVRATNSVGDGAWSDSATATPAAQKPDAPAVPTVTAKHQGVAVSWTAPAANGADITGYDVQHRACTATPLTCTTSPTWGDWASHTHTGTGTTATIGSLTNGTAYQVQVRATNSVGDSAWSVSAKAVPAPQPPDKPAAPSASSRHQGLAVSWTAPSVNGSAITGYGVQYRACTATPLTCTTSPTWGDWASHTHTGTGTTATISSLTNGTAYQVQVRANSAAGNSAWSDSAKQTPAVQVPDAPTAPTLTVWNESLRAAWTAPAANGADIADYDVRYRACTATPKTCANNPAWGSWTDRSGETSADTATTATLTGLTNGTAYQVQVRATNSVGDGAWSDSTTATPAAQKPTTPAAPSLTHGDRSLGVSWAAPAANGATITDYDVRYCDNGTGCDASGEWTALDDTGDNASDTATTASVTGLTNGTAYQVQVRAANSVGDSAWSASASEYPSTVPGVPTSLTLSVGDESLGVSWTAPASTGGSAVTGYKVGRCSTGCDTNSNWTVTTLTGTGTTTTLSSLTNGTAYQVRVAAVNRSGDSAWSSSANATPARVPDTPAAPTVTVWNESLNVSWTAPAANGSAITGYDVQHRACTATPKTCANSPTWGDWTSHTHTGTGTTATLSSLTNGTAQQVQVRATNSVGDGAWSDSTSATPAAQKPSTPAAPTLTAGTRSVAVSWTAPQTNGSAITGYDVRYRACTATPLTCATSPTWGDWASHTHTGTGTTAIVTGLTNGTAYQVQVRANSAAGDSAWSPSAKGSPSTVPGSPTVTLSGVPGSPTLSRISWTLADDGGTTIRAYEIDWRCEPGEAWASNRLDARAWTVAANVTSRDSSIAECSSKLGPNQEYRFKVRAANATGWGLYSWPFVKTAPPSVNASAISAVLAGTQMTVSWTASDGGLEISDHDVRYRRKDTNSTTPGDQPGNWTTLSGANDPGTSTTATLTGLTADTAYQVQVRATNAMGAGSWSGSLEWPQPPGTPGPLTVTAENLALAVSWTEPAANGSAITDYDVQYRACTATPLSCTTSPAWGSWTDRTGETTTDTATSLSVTGLTNGTAYQVRVRAANSIGESAWSASGQAMPAKQPPDAPAAPALTIAQTSLGVSWTEPAINGSAVTDYDVRYRACTATPLSCTSSPAWGSWTDRTGETSTDTATAATISGLTQGTAYEVQVRASNSIGDGAWSDSTTAIPAVAPSTPAAPTLTVRNLSVAASWTAPDNGGSAITDYDVQYRACTNSSDLTCATSPTWGAWTDRTGETASDTGTTVIVTGLTNGTAYQARVRAANPAGDGAWSAASAKAVPALSKPDPPNAPTLTAKHQAVAVSWSAPDNGGSAITDYDVQYRACTNSSDLTCATSPTWSAWTDRTGETASDTDTSGTISGLTNSTAYQVQVRAANSLGESGWSAASTVIPAPTAPDAPAAPDASYRHTALYVTFTAPAANGAAITDYDVRYRACTNSSDLSCATSPTWGAWTDRTGETASDTGTSVRISGLTNGTAYQVQVRAANSLGESGWSASGQGTPAPKPATPTGLTVTTGNNSWTASWDAPSGPIYQYAVDFSFWSDNLGGYWLQYNSTTIKGKNNTSLTRTWAVLNGKLWRVRVKAENLSGWSPVSDWLEFTVIGPPPVPTNVSLTVKDESLDVSWTSPSNSSGSAISDYDVQYRACTATPLNCTSNPAWGDWTEWNADDTSTATSATITGLTNGTAYQVQVRSTNAAHDSAWSASAQAISADKPNAPSAPTLTAKHQAIGVTWTEPNTNGGTITDYDVQYRACTATPLTCATSPTWGAWTSHTHNGAGRMATIGSLTNGTAYQVQVRATNAAGTGAWSASAKATPAPQPPEAPGAPTVTVWNAELRLSWTAPSINGSAITDYDVQHRACTATPLTCTTSPTWGDWTEWNAGDTSTTTSATVTGLTNDTAYQVQVRAGSSVGDGAWSASTKATPTAQRPGAPGAPTLTYGKSSLSASWTAPAANGAAITDYDVQYRACTATPLTCTSSPTWGDWTEWNADNTSTATSATVTGLTNGTAYQVQVRAGNSVGDGAWSSSSASEYPSTAPAAPAAPTLTFGSQVLNVSWSAPSSDGGDAVSGYKVGRCSTGCDTDSNWTVTTLTGTGTTTSLTGLTNGTSYQVRVAATNRSGDSAWSGSTTESPAYKPAKPAKPTVTRGNRQITVSWTAPADGGAAISDYNVNYREQNKSAVAHPFTGNGTTTTITGLTNGKRYQVAVQAVNKAGSSDWSAWSDLVTPATVPSAPSAPTLAHGAASLSVSWTAPATNGDAINDYDVQYRACTATPKTCTSNPTWGSWTSHAHTGTGTTATISSLTNGTAFQVQVRASNSVGTGSWSASAKEHPSTAPGAPAAPTLSVWHASLTASWSAPTGDGGSAVTGYGVQYRPCTASPLTCTTSPTWGGWSSHTHTGTGTTATITGLTNGTAYQVQIAAKNRSGTGAWSPSASAAPAAQKPTAPAAPALTVKHRALGVSWTAPSANGSAITDHDVQYQACTATDKTCKTSPAWGTWTDRTGETAADTSTTVELTSLTNGTAYRVRVRAANSLGESDWSPHSGATPATTPGAPGRPTVTTRAQSLAVSWTAPSSDGGAVITGYKVQHCDQSTGCDADDEWTTETHTGTGTTATIYNLTNGTTYRVRVAATNSVGDSAWSSYRTGKPKDKPAQPDAPTVVSGNASLSVKWTAPASNGSSITGYKVRYCGGDTADCYSDDSTDWKEKSASGTSTTISSLTNGTAYRVKVRARNAVGDSDWSSETEGTPGAPAAPSRPSLTEGNSQLTVSWTAPSNRGSAITDYTVQYCGSTSDCTDDSNWTDDSPYDTSTSHTITGLTNGTTYKVRVRAQNSRGWGGWSSEATATPATVPGQPDSPTLTAKNRALDVSWSAPSQTGGSAITGYSVRYCDNSTGCDAANEWTVRTVSSGSTTTYTITGLTNGKTYQVGVAAKNRKGLSAYSSSTTATPAALPGKPTSLAVESAHQSLKVTWTASAGNGSTITGYEVEYRKQNSDNTWPSDWTSHSHYDTSTSTTIDSLTNGSAYQVRVRATSNNGNSGWASTVTGTPKAVPDAPDAPTLTAGDRKIDLSWSAPNSDNGSAVTDYDVRYRKQNTNSTWPTSWTTLSHTGTATTAAMTSLTNGSAYQVQVRAENANGDGPWSSAATATPAGKPLKPSTPTLTAGDGQLTVTWTAPSGNGSAITGYTLQYCDSTSDCTDDDNWTDDSPYDTSTSYTITGLTNGTAYKVRLRATNNVGDGPWSSSATGTPVGAPSAPDNLTFVSGNAFLTVSWTTASNGSTISGHQVRYCNTSDSDKDCYSDYDDWTTVSVSGTATTKKITGLTNGDYYDVEVRANSNGGYSSWSYSSSGTPGAPAKPTIGTVTAGDDQFTVAWSAPNSNGDDIQYYEVSYCNETNGDCTAGTWNVETQWDTSTLSLDVWSLEDATKYKVRVRAVNNRGAGEWSTVKTVTTT